MFWLFFPLGIERNQVDIEKVIKESTLAAILSRENLTLALKRVEANKGAPGVDGMTTEELRKYIFEHPGELTSAILSGKYRPAPVKRVTIPKPEKGKFRNLGIPTVIDRLVQQAVAQKLSYSYDGTFSMSSFGFRPTRSAHDAIFKVMSEADQGYVWAVDMDLEKFFRYGQSQPIDPKTISENQGWASDIAHHANAQIGSLDTRKGGEVGSRSHAGRAVIATTCEHLFG